MRQHSLVLTSLVVLALGALTVGVAGAAAPADPGLVLQENETENTPVTTPSTNGSQGPTAFVAATPDDPGATASHEFAAPVVNSTARLNGITINYSQTGIDVSNVTEDNVARLGVDLNGARTETRIDFDYTRQVRNVTSTEDTVTVLINQQTGTYGEVTEFVLVLEDMPNPPEKGFYNFSFDVNPEQEGGLSTGQMPIGDVGPQVNRTAGTLTHPSGSAGPGFTAVIAVVAVLAVGLLANRRD